MKNKTVKIEDTKFIAEEVNYDIANKYLELGWILISHYVIAVRENDQLNQKIRYVLAWQNSDEEPPHPDYSFHKEKLKIIEEMVDLMGHEDF